VKSTEENRMMKLLGHEKDTWNAKNVEPAEKKEHNEQRRRDGLNK